MSVRDVLIVGAGPSGLATAIAARQNGLDYAVVEKAFADSGDDLVRPESLSDRHCRQDGFDPLIRQYQSALSGKVPLREPPGLTP